MDLEQDIGFGKKENEEETEVGGTRVLEHCETHVMEEQKETEVESVGDKEMERETEGVEMEKETDWDNWYDPWDEWLHSSHGSAYWLGTGKASAPSKLRSRFASKSFSRAWAFSLAACRAACASSKACCAAWTAKASCSAAVFLARLTVVNI